MIVRGVFHHHGGMIAEYRRRFWVSLALTPPILALSHGFWELFGLGTPVQFAGIDIAAFALSSVVYFYGGWSRATRRTSSPSRSPPELP